MTFDALISLPYLWDELKRETRPILLYGTGNGADKILDVMETRGIPCAGIFASDGFVRSRSFRSMQVLSYSDAIAEFGQDVVILVAFGSPRDEVLDFVDTLIERHTVYIPDVPLFADDLEAELFTPEYAIAARQRIERAAKLFEGEDAELYWEMLAYRITGDARYLRRTESFADSVAACLPSDIVRVIDGGAFNGDTARVFLDAFPTIKRIVCAEPDARTFRRLAEFAAEDGRVIAVNASLGADVGIDEFASSASRASAVEKQSRRSKCVEVDRLTIDLISGHSDASEPIAEANFFGTASGDGRLLVKLDVEGAEKSALEGAKSTLAKEKVALAVALYHRTADIFDLPIAISSAMPGCKMHLRRVRCIPGWELTLFAY